LLYPSAPHERFAEWALPSDGLLVARQVLSREADERQIVFYCCCYFSKLRIIVSSIKGAEICWCGDLPPLCGSLPYLKLAQPLLARLMAFLF
jgi:hypothetical protein